MSLYTIAVLVPTHPIYIYIRRRNVDFLHPSSSLHILYHRGALHIPSMRTATLIQLGSVQFFSLSCLAQKNLFPCSLVAVGNYTALSPSCLLTQKGVLYYTVGKYISSILFKRSMSPMLYTK